MKRIGNSKEPTERQIKNILANLHEKFPHISFSMTMDAWHYDSGNSSLLYEIYRSDTQSNLVRRTTWPELLSVYFRVMKEGLDAS